MGRDATAILLETNAAAAHGDSVATEALPDGAKKHVQEIRSVDGDVRILVARETSHGLGENLLTVGIEERLFLEGHAAADQLVLEPQQRQLLHGVGLQIDSDPGGLVLAAGLEYPASDADPVQAKCRRQTANSAADQEHFHRDNLPTMLDGELGSGLASHSVGCTIYFTALKDQVV